MFESALANHIISARLNILSAPAMAANFFKLLVASPETNPRNRKAKSIPVLNPFDQYGRVFFFSWLGFMVAFLSWYAFPPLVSLSYAEAILNLAKYQLTRSPFPS